MHITRDHLYRIADEVDRLGDRIRCRVAVDGPAMPGSALVAALPEVNGLWRAKTERYAEVWNEFAGRLDSTADGLSTADDEVAATIESLFRERA